MKKLLIKGAILAFEGLAIGIGATIPFVVGEVIYNRIQRKAVKDSIKDLNDAFANIGKEDQE